MAKIRIAKAKSRDYKEVELPQFFVPTFSKFLVRMLGKCLEVFTPLTSYFKMAAYILSEV